MAYADEATVRGEWVRYIYRTKRISDSTRVLALALAEGMDVTGRIEASREEIAALLSRAPRRISDRYTDAIEAGVLKRVTRGNRKNKSVFQALIPEGEQVTHGGHVYGGEQVTKTRSVSWETKDTRGSREEEETRDTRGSCEKPMTGHPGVAQSGLPIREGLPESPSDALIPISEVETPEAKNKRLTREENRRIKALTDHYYEAVHRMGDWQKIRSVAKKAAAAGYTDEQIKRGMDHIVREGRYGLSSESLRIAIERTAPQRHLRVVGGHQPYRNGYGNGDDLDPWAQAGDLDD